MKTLIRHGGIGVLLLFCWLSDATAQSALDRIAKIVITNIGPAAVSEDLVRANIHVKVGDPYVRTSVDEDVKNLYATGYFQNIQVADQLGDDGIVVTYLLEGKLTLTSIKFEGNSKYSNSKLLKKVTSKPSEPLDERKLFSDCQTIEEMYQKAGYPHTDVKYVFNNYDENAGRSGVTFQITEGLKIRVVDVVFNGAHAFSQRKLRWTIKTRRHWMWSWITRGGIYKEDQLEDDKDKLADFYQGKGYIDFELTNVVITNLTPRRMKIEFDIYEGTQYRVGSVTFTGTNALFPPEQLTAWLKMRHEQLHSKTNIGVHGLEADTGLTFTPQAMDDDRQSIEDFYGAKGYIDVKEGPNLEVKRIPNTETGTMDIEYAITAGQQSHIERIIIKGNVKTKDKVIRRELSVSPGDVFDMVRVRTSKERLEGLGFFEKVDTEPEPRPDIPDHKDLIVGVDEKSTGQFSFGAGYNTVDSLLGFVEVSQVNFDLFNPPYFTGGGQKFRLKVQLGLVEQDEEVSFVEPWFLNRKLTLSIDLYHSLYQFQSLNNLYNQSDTGAKVGLTRALGSDYLIGGLNYTVETIGIIDVNTNAPNTILHDSGYTFLNRVGASLAYDTRNSYQLANKGQRTELDAQVVDGSREYYKLEAKSEWDFKGLFPGHVLELLGKMGVASGLDGQDVPFFDRYYLGGEYDMRGYDYRAVGPREVTQDGTEYEPIGGDTYWLGSAEYSIPTGIPRLRLAVFYDIGNVIAGPYSFGSTTIHGKEPFPGSVGFPPLPFSTYVATDAGRTGYYSDNYGFGLRLDIPQIGPLRLDYGIPLHHDSFSDSSGKFQFNVGFSRPF
jgi:outer membrane protein insertion porin family